MGPILTGLVKLQVIEVDLTRLRRRMRTRQHAVHVQESKIAQHQSDYDNLHTRGLEKRMSYDSMSVTLKANTDRIEKLRTDLNGAKTNKEYATLLTEINTQKADSAKVEEEALKVLAEADSVKIESDAVQAMITGEQEKLAAIKATSADELEKLDTMINSLQTKRDAAAESVDAGTLALFDRLAEQYDGEGLAPVDVTGRAPRQSYSCGGCFMSLNAEHANALSSRDEIRQCDNCKRILYLEDEKK
jgi:predicted  nucleic acid-binding Zn-ribbon protein